MAAHVLPVSLVIVSDYEPGAKTWADERQALRAFLGDPAGIPAEIIVMETAPPSGSPPNVPADIAALGPAVTVRFAATSSSAALKDAATSHCRHDLVAVAEADSPPDPGWLSFLADAMQRDPALSAVSGRTIYGLNASHLRVLSLLDRGFMETPVNGEYVHVSNNGALYRKSVLEQFPYPPEEQNPFVSGEIRITTMQQAGVRFGIVPSAVMRHAYGGATFIMDVRRNKGYQAARIMARDRPHKAKILLVLGALKRSLRHDWRTLRAVGRDYLRWWDWPLAALLFLLVRIPEAQGAWRVRLTPEAFAATTSYR